MSPVSRNFWATGRLPRLANQQIVFIIMRHPLRAVLVVARRRSFVRCVHCYEFSLLSRVYEWREEYSSKCDIWPKVGIAPRNTYGV